MYSRSTHVWGQVGLRQEDWAEQWGHGQFAEFLVHGPLRGRYQAQKSWRREESAQWSVGQRRRIGHKSHRSVNSPKDLILLVGFADVGHQAVNSSGCRQITERSTPRSHWCWCNGRKKDLREESEDTQSGSLRMRPGSHIAHCGSCHQEQSDESAVNVRQSTTECVAGYHISSLTGYSAKSNAGAA